MIAKKKCKETGFNDKTENVNEAAGPGYCYVFIMNMMIT
jgi:hypothetical protein